jgi:hypothetical protein
VKRKARIEASQELSLNKKRSTKSRSTTIIPVNSPGFIPAQHDEIKVLSAPR